MIKATRWIFDFFVQTSNTFWEVLGDIVDEMRKDPTPLIFVVSVVTLMTCIAWLIQEAMA